MKKLSVKSLVLGTLSLCTFLASCHKPFDLKTQSESLYTRTLAAAQAAQSQEEKEALFTNMVDSMYILLDEHMGEPYSDTLFVGIAYLFTQEQKEVLFNKMPQSMRENEDIAKMYEVFQREAATSAENAYTDFAALTPEGNHLALSQLVGKTDYVLVDFWASWCGPCRRLIPVLKEIYAGQPKGHFQILSCSVDQDEAAWLNALDEEQMPWPQVRQDAEHLCSDLYGVVSIPTTILINSDGTIIARNPDEAQLEELLFSE